MPQNKGGFTITKTTQDDKSGQDDYVRLVRLIKQCC